MSKAIAVVEDDESIREMLRYYFQSVGYAVRAYESGEALFAGEEGLGLPALYILDIMLPGMDGLEILRRLREGRDTADVPVIMLTARSAEMDRVAGLENGADDYVVKPFGIMELQARVKAVLRRTERRGDRVLTWGDVELDPAAPVKKRIIGATLITVVCALLISNLVGVLLFRSREMDAARNTLQELLVLMDAQSAITDPDGLAQQFHAAAPDKRLTIIDTDGTVLADTEANPQTLEDHNSRPEVEQAAATGWGEAVRHSETLGTSMFYVSKRFADGMVGRASMPLSSIDSLVWNGVWGFLIASAAGLLLALILARRTANRVMAPLSAVGSALQSVLDGTRASGLEDYQADDELRPILRYIDKLMERLGGYIQSITAERDKVGLILDCMDEGLILLDEAGNVLAINRAARTLFGFPEGEEDDGALLLTRSRRLREAIQESRVRHSSVVLDVDALTEDAQSLRLFVSPVSGRQYEGQAVGTSILISDVTELKKAEGIRSEFTANVSHELKTPSPPSRASPTCWPPAWWPLPRIRSASSP